MFDICCLSDHDRFDWLRLIRSPGIGPVTFQQLLARFGSAEKAIAQAPDLARQKGRRRPLTLIPQQEIIDEIKAAEKIGARYIASCEPDYPDRLRHIPGAPPVICCYGDTGLMTRPALAIVGARNASAIGRKFTNDLAEELGQEGFVIVSGLARGIDGAAHKAALPKGTIAVVAGGLDVIYPPEHRKLTVDIAQQGLIVSEMPPGYQPKARDFPRRNRIISGLALGVIVVEAAERSGTLVTARYALEQGREVFAVPGSPMDPRCQGTNRLIRDGATLIQSAQNVIEGLQNISGQICEQEENAFSFEGVYDYAEDETDTDIIDLVFDLLSYTPIHRDILIRQTDHPPAAVINALMELVLSEKIEELDGGYYVRCPDGNE
ncbi:MAG: DNA-processing protein DprA [bacterium]